jgi:hypothetical protein
MAQRPIKFRTWDTDEQKMFPVAAMYANADGDF